MKKTGQEVLRANYGTTGDLCFVSAEHERDFLWIFDKFQRLSQPADCSKYST